MANSAPTVAIGLSLAGLAAAAAYGSGPVITRGSPMLVIANAYRLVEPGGRPASRRLAAITLTLGFITGLSMIAATRLRRWPARRRWPGPGVSAWKAR